MPTTALRCPQARAVVVRALATRQLFSTHAKSVFLKAGCVIASLGMVVVGAQAAPANSNKHVSQLPAIVVTGTTSPQPAFDVPASATVITAKHIASGAPGASLARTLARVPGLVAQNRQSMAQDLQISSRGYGARAPFGVRGVRLMMDGLPYSLPDGQGQTDPFDMALASRIEVLRGPSAVMYGNAAGGVIQVFTRNGPQQPTASANVQFAGHGTQIQRLELGGTAGKLNYIANISRFKRTGYRQHSAARRNHLYTKLRYKPSDKASLTLIFNGENQPWAEDPSGLNKTQLGHNPRQAVDRVDRFNAGKFVHHRQGGLVYNQAIGDDDRVHATAWLGSRKMTQFLPFRGAGPTSGGAVIGLNNHSGGASARWTHWMHVVGVPVKTTAGVDYQGLHERRKGFVNNNGVKGALQRNESDHSWRLGAYAQTRITLGRWQLDGGFRHAGVKFDVSDHFTSGMNPDDSGSREFSRFTGYASLLYNLSATTNLYVSYGRGFQTPTFAELAYRPDGTSGLNFDLGPSSSNNYEVGLKAQLRTHGKLRLSVYHINTDNEITTFKSVNGRSTFHNAGSTQRTGIEVSYSQDLGNDLHGYFAASWLQATFQSGTFAGSSLPGVPRTTIYGALDWSYAPLGFHATGDVQWRGKVYANDSNADSADSDIVAGLQAGFQQQYAHFKFREFARINNLFDRHYVGAVLVNAGNDRFYEPAPGRNYLAGINISYSF